MAAASALPAMAPTARVAPYPPTELISTEGNLDELQQLCARANRAYRERSFKRAVRLYTLALAMSRQLGLPSEQQAIIYCNRACANLQRPGSLAFGEALRDAERAKSACRVTERAQYDLALMMVRNKDNRLQPDFRWYPDQTLGNRARGDPVAKRRARPAPHTARHATLRPATTLLPRLAQTARPPRTRKPRPALELPSPGSVPYAQQDYSVPTPQPGTDTSLLDRESRRIATELATDVEYEKAVEAYAERDAKAAARKAELKERDSTLTLDLSMDGDALLRSITPELDILTPAVVREGLVRQTSQKIYTEMKKQQEAEQMDSSIVAEEPDEEGEEETPPAPLDAAGTTAEPEKPADESYIPEEPVDPTLTKMAGAPE